MTQYNLTEAPKCTRDAGHVWRALHAVVGGLEENPGVIGNGGGVIEDDHCVVCGCGRRTDTWAQDAETGERETTVAYAAGLHQCGVDLVPADAWVDVDGSRPGVQYAEAWGLHWLRGAYEEGPYATEDAALTAAPSPV